VLKGLQPRTAVDARAHRERHRRFRVTVRRDVVLHDCRSSGADDALDGGASLALIV
jgi:hypothetical protein